MYIQSTQNFGNVYTKLGKTLENYTKLWKCNKVRQNFGNVYTKYGKLWKFYIRSIQKFGNVYTK